MLSGTGNLSTIWDIIFHNDSLATWAFFYCIDREDYKNKKMYKIIISYSQTRNIGKARVNALKKGKY